MKDLRFSVFTPCFNGERTISRVFRAMESQTYKNFEWILINDGSIDQSDSVIRKLISSSPIKDQITYVVQNNLGKHQAWNRAIDLASGELFVCADADDGFIPETLEFFSQKAKEVDLLASPTLCGIAVCAFNPKTGKRIGMGFREDGFVCDDLELAFKYKIRGEKWFCNRTDILRMEQYRFPTLLGPYYPEGRLWFGLAKDGYKMTCYNNPVRAYFYEENSLSNRLRKYNIRVALISYHYYFWEMSHIWLRIISYDFKAGLRILFRTPIAAGYKLCGGVIIWLSRRVNLKWK